MPVGTAMKTGTLREVSALAGVIPTRDRGLVWFAIINRGNGITGLRSQQDQILQELTKKWGSLPTFNSSNSQPLGLIGDSGRIQKLLPDRNASLSNEVQLDPNEIQLDPSKSP